jgi:two-component system LytT family sensor kinase
VLPLRLATIVNLAGFTAALALYAMLLAMVLRRPRGAMEPPRAASAGTGGAGRDRLLIATAALGLVWNLAAVRLYGFEGRPPAPPLEALALTALGFLPAVVVHAVLRPALAGAQDRGARAVVAAGYALSVVACLLHVAEALRGQPRSALALRMLVAGFCGIISVLAGRGRRQVNARRVLTLAALAVFAVSALHLSQHEALADSWLVEIVGHHASLPLAVAILYQDYPFAFADIFLERALVLVLVLALVVSAHAAAVAWLGPAAPDPLPELVWLGVGAGIAASYPLVRRGIHWFVGTVVLRRPDYVALHAGVTRALAGAETPEQALEEARRQLAPALAARQSGCWRIEVGAPLPMGARAPGAVPQVAAAHAAWAGAPDGPAVATDVTRTSAVVVVPTAEAPRYAVSLGELAGGRRLLSDDLAMLEAVARTLARRIDLLRLARERYERRVREAEMRQLAAEAELRALRAQTNPHFLFNALTTIGYLIQRSPAVALEKLLQLTDLLRRVLRSEGELTTLGKELELVRLYLDLERARFEERLRFTIDVPVELQHVTVPSLLLQPIVENAVKHGIAPAAAGGCVEVRAGIENDQGPTGARMLTVAVRNTGRPWKAGAGPASGIGLRSVEKRLRHHYGDDASLRCETDGGTVVTVRLPLAPPRADAPRGEPRR